MFAGPQESFQSKFSILKKDSPVSRAKKVRFDTIVKAVKRQLNGSSEGRLRDMDTSMITKSWASSKGSIRKRRALLKADLESASNKASVASLPIRPEEEFEVEAILNHKKFEGAYLYLLKWKGYSETENTWEPSRNLSCKSILDAYHQEHGLVSPLSAVPRSRSLAKHSRSRYKVSKHKKGSKHEQMATESKSGMNGFLSGRVVLKKKKRKRGQSAFWSMEEVPCEWELKRNTSEVKELVVSISLEKVTLHHPNELCSPLHCETTVSDTSKRVQSHIGGDADVSHVGDLISEGIESAACCCTSTLADDLPGMKESPLVGHLAHSNEDIIRVADIQSNSLTPTIEHSLACLKHDHPYTSLTQTLPSVLTPPPSAEPCNELSFPPQKNDVFSIAISPPLSPSSQSQSSPPYHHEVDQIDSDSCYPQLTDDSDNDHSNSLNPSPLSSDYKLHWSSASSVCSDKEVLAKDKEAAHVSPVTMKPQEETNHFEASKRSPKLSRMSLSAKSFPRGGSVLSRWRKGPVPLPRLFSRRHSGASLLQTNAAKQLFAESVPHPPVQDLEKPCRSEIMTGSKNLSLSLKKKGISHLERLKLKKPLVRFSCNDENHCDQVAVSETLESQNALKKAELKKSQYASVCAYKEQLMNWQYELNKQRDGTDEIIYVENDLDMDPPPSDFNYVCSNVYTEGVPNPSHPDLTSSLCGCECYYLGRKCGPKSEYCCAHMAGSKFAYTPAGKVKVQPGTPIYECNAKCSCPSDCSNRIVQLGRKIPLCIFRTKGRGWGVKTIEPIKPNTFVTEYVGEVITNEEAERRGKKCDAEGITYLFDLDFEDENSAFTVDAARFGNISHFFNHSCDPNLVVYSVWIDTLDKRLPRLSFFTTKNISVGEELTFDYQMNRNSDYPDCSRPRMPCLCGSKNCLGYIN